MMGKIILFPGVLSVRVEQDPPDRSCENCISYRNYGPMGEGCVTFDEQLVTLRAAEGCDAYEE